MTEQSKGPKFINCNTSFNGRDGVNAPADANITFENHTSIGNGGSGFTLEPSAQSPKESRLITSIKWAGNHIVQIAIAVLAGGILWFFGIA